jgi:hypothetical protein
MTIFYYLIIKSIIKHCQAPFHTISHYVAIFDEAKAVQGKRVASPSKKNKNIFFNKKR